MDALNKLFNCEIDVYVGDTFLKTITRHVRRPDQFYPTRGVVEVQKREWVKVHACSASPFPRWRLYVEENHWISADIAIKR